MGNRAAHWHYDAGEDTTCPHCRRGVQFRYPEWRKPFDGEHFARSWIQEDQKTAYEISVAVCPSCGLPIIGLHCRGRVTGQRSGGEPVYEWESRLLFPRHRNRRPAPEQVPPAIAEDYTEAGLVLGDSPKASAALSRRCLQHILEDAKAANVSPANLSDEIDEVLKKLPPHIAKDLDAIRNVGNFAAHPNKSMNTGEIIPVEPGEAEWTLEVAWALLDWYYAEPIRAQERRATLNAKLAQMGKLPMKKP